MSSSPFWGDKTAPRVNSTCVLIINIVAGVDVNLITPRTKLGIQHPSPKHARIGTSSQNQKETNVCTSVSLKIRLSNFLPLVAFCKEEFLENGKHQDNEEQQGKHTAL